MRDHEPKERAMVEYPHWLPKDAPEGSVFVTLEEGMTCTAVYVREWGGTLHCFVPRRP